MNKCNIIRIHFFECKKCNDTGYLEDKMCECMRRECVLMGYQTSGLGVLLTQQSFDNFSLKYYTGEDRFIAEQNFNACKGYAEGFTKSSERDLERHIFLHR